MSEPKIEFYKLRDFGAKVNATVEFIRENFKGLFKNLLVIGGIVGIFFSLIFRNFVLNMLGIVESPDAVEDAGFISLILGNYFLFILGIWIAFAMMNSVTYTYIKIYNQGTIAEENTLGNIFKKALSLLPKIMVLQLITTILTFFGAMAFILPGIYLGIVFTLSIPVLVFESKGIGDAISRPFTLIKDKWFSTLGLAFVSGLMAYAVQLVFSLPSSVLYFVGMFSNIDPNNLEQDPTQIFDMFTGIYMTVAVMISSLGYMISTSIPAIAMSYQYSNLVERTEGRGLMNEIEGFDKEE